MSTRNETRSQNSPQPTDKGVGGATSRNVVEAIKTKKPPPAEPRQNLWTRRLVLFSFWVIAICLGVPVWWKTTAVYRANLPLQLMTDWGDGKVCSPQFPLNIVLDTPDLHKEEAKALLRITQDALDDLNEFPAHHLRLSHKGPEEDAQNVLATGAYSIMPDDEAADLTVKLLASPGAANPSSTLQPHTRTLDVSYAPGTIPASSSTSSALANYIADQLQNVFTEEKTILSHLLSTASSNSAKTMKLSPEIQSTLSRRSTRSVKYAPTYHITFSLFTPAALPNAWDIETALRQTFSPLLGALSPISNFTIDTQVQPYAAFSRSTQPIFDESLGKWLLQREDLGGFINAAEWPLSPSIGESPTLNFLIYVPDPSHTPLTIHRNNSGTNSWLVPQWGGVSIHNPPTSGTRQQHLTADDLQPHMLTFTHHLIQLLNVPSTPTNSLPLRLSSLGRQHAATLILRASTTLASLAHLVVQLPSISIPDKAAYSVDNSLAHLERACLALRAGNFHLALENAREAEREAEQAFFEKSMVGQVYFPDEHKVAVYLPLLGPIAVPLFLGATREFKSYWAGRRAVH